MKKTAVEWLIIGLENLNLIKEGDIENELFRQIELEAKEMEKQQQGYSEEEVLEILKDSRDNIPNDVYVVDWFEQFKNK